MSQEAIKNPKKTRGIPFEKGNPGGPGRPKGSFSIKDQIRKRLEDHPEELQKIVQYFVKDNRELMWQMLEGRPQQDVTSDGQKLIPTPIYGGQSIQIPGHDGNPEDIQPEAEN